MAISNINAPAAGTPLPFDSVGSAQYPLAKLTFGAEGASVLVADANGARLPVQIGGTLPGFAATPTFDLSPASLAALETVSATVTGTVALDAGTLAALENIQAAVTGTVELGATTLAALETISVAGVATEVTLAALNGKLAPLESGRAPVAVQRLGTTSRAYGASLRIATSGGASVRTASGVSATEVTLISTVDGFVRIGDNAVVAADAAGSFPVFAGVPWTEQITSGQFVAFIRAGSTDGSLFIRPVA